MWPLAAVIGGRINGFFLICMAVLPGRKKVAVITRCPYYRGGRKAGLHGIPSCLFLRAACKGFVAFFHAFLREEEQYDQSFFLACG